MRPDRRRRYALNNPTTYTDATGLAADPGCSCPYNTDPVLPDPEDPYAPTYDGELPDQEDWDQAWHDISEDYSDDVLIFGCNNEWGVYDYTMLSVTICDHTPGLCANKYTDYLLAVHYYLNGDEFKGMAADFAGPLTGAAIAGTKAYLKSSGVA